MLYHIGLLASVAVGAWLCLDVVMAEVRRRRSLCVACLGGFAALWAGAELLLGGATTPGELGIARRLLFLGVAGATVCWYWVAVEADAPRWFRAARWRVLVPAIPLALVHSCLYWAPDGVYVSLYSKQPVHGPLYPVAMLNSYVLIALGLVHYVRAAVRLQHSAPWRVRALAAAVLIPLACNVIYHAGFITLDVTPALLGFTAIMIRFAVVDPGLGLYLPLARGDVIEQLAVGVVVTDLDDRIIDANRSACRFLGTDAPVGRIAADLVAGVGEGIEVTRFPLQSHVATPGRAIVLADRSDAVRAEKRLELAARLEALGSLTAGIAHEINNPLAYVRANLNHVESLFEDLLRADADATPAVEWKRRLEEEAESLADASDGVERIALLITRLMGFARDPEAREEFETKPVDLCEISLKAIDVAGIGLASEAIALHAPDSLRVLSSEPVLVQILVNLLLNAIQASDRAPEIEVEVREDGDEVVIAVSDRGPGLDPGSRDRVFDPFYTTKPAGSGLGLSISYDLALRLDGRIEARNRRCGGATFSLILPREPAERCGGA